MKLISILAATAALASAANVVTVPIERHASKKQDAHLSMKNAAARYNLKLSSSKRDAPLTDYSDELYTASVTFGNGQTFTTDLDTGSSDVWVRGPKCVGDANSGCQGSKIDTTDKTLKSSTTTWKVSYGDGSGASGFVYKGPVALGGVKATVNFGVTTKENGMTGPNDGLWGLAYSSLNDISGGNFVQAAGITSLAFYFSDSSDGDKGELTLNGVDNSKFSGSLAYIPITSQTYYQFDPSGATFTVNGKAIGVSDTSAIADTGTTLLLGPQSVTDKINSAIGAGAYDSNSGVYSIDCGVLKSGPTVQFNLQGININLSPKEYVLKQSDGSCASGISSIGSLTGGGPAWIFGDTFLRAAYNVYDIQNNRLGFAQAVHPGQGPVVPTTTKSVKTTAVTSTVVPTSARASTTVKPKCNHSECVSGAFLRATCSDCAAAVCAADDYCCSNAWDSQCVSEVADYCNIVC
ncbi:aspartic peptidase domain-containing protein [Chytriomyces sp. MP71]|nr:aspartic peptidase domain-containing protein [Chytriomyces sp. MP71]